MRSRFREILTVWLLPVFEVPYEVNFTWETAPGIRLPVFLYAQSTRCSLSFLSILQLWGLINKDSCDSVKWRLSSPSSRRRLTISPEKSFRKTESRGTKKLGSATTT